MAYLLLAVPAAFLPFSSFVLLIWAAICAAFDRQEFQHPDQEGLVHQLFIANIAATLCQLPLYMTWAACSTEFKRKFRLKLAFVIYATNAFGIPWFLLCKYQSNSRRPVMRTAAAFRALFRKPSRRVRVVIVSLIVIQLFATFLFIVLSKDSRKPELDLVARGFLSLILVEFSLACLLFFSFAIVAVNDSKKLFERRQHLPGAANLFRE